MLISKKDLDIRDSEPPCVLLGLEGLSQFRQNALPSSETIAMVDQESYNVNIRDKKIKNGVGDEEIMVPYSRVLLISWDKKAGTVLKSLRNSKKISRRQLAESTNGVVSEATVIKLEFGEVEAVSREKLDALLFNLGYDVTSVFPSVVVKNF